MKQAATEEPCHPTTPPDLKANGTKTMYDTMTIITRLARKQAAIEAIAKQPYYDRPDIPWRDQSRIIRITHNPAGKQRPDCKP